MPTPHKRIPVVQDPELTEALHRIAPYYPESSRAKIVHDLAVKGAEAILVARKQDEDAIQQLVALSTTRGGLIDWDVLEQIDELAWGE